MRFLSADASSAFHIADCNSVGRSVKRVKLVRGAVSESTRRVVNCDVDGEAEEAKSEGGAAGGWDSSLFEDEAISLWPI